jgi:ABC-type transporter MlaC component
MSNGEITPKTNATITIGAAAVLIVAILGAGWKAGELMTGMQTTVIENTKRIKDQEAAVSLNTMTIRSIERTQQDAVRAADLDRDRLEKVVVDSVEELKDLRRQTLDLLIRQGARELECKKQTAWNE